MCLIFHVFQRGPIIDFSWRLAGANISFQVLLLLRCNRVNRRVLVTLNNGHVLVLVSSLKFEIADIKAKREIFEKAHICSATPYLVRPSFFCSECNVTSKKYDI
jgi:hypothetical protein